MHGVCIAGGSGRVLVTCKTMQKLMSKSDFARLAGVNPSTVTRLVKTMLKNAAHGARIDSAHPDAVAYLQRQEAARAPEPVPGIDPLYEQVVEFCQQRGSYAPSGVQRKFRIGYERSCAILATMKAAGLVPDDAPKRPPRTKPADETKTSHDVKPRGQAGVAADKKSAPPIQQEPDEVPDDISAFADMTLRELIRRFGTDVRFVDWLKAVKAIEDIHEKRLKNAATQGTLIARRVVEDGLIDTINTTHKKLLTDGAKSIAARVKSAAQLGETDTQLEDIVVEQISSFIQPCKAKMGRLMRNV